MRSDLLLECGHPTCDERETLDPFGHLFCIQKVLPVGQTLPTGYVGKRINIRLYRLTVPSDSDYCAVGKFIAPCFYAAEFLVEGIPAS